MHQFLTSKAKPSAPLNPLRGFLAQLVMEGEYSGKPASCLVLITDQHDVSSETIQGFQPVLRDLLGLSVDLDNLWQFPKFKSVLKELNNKGHLIYN